MSRAADSAALAAAIEAGAPTPLGAMPGARGVNFVLHSAVADRVELCLYDAGTRQLRGSVVLPGRTGSAWHGFLPAPLAAAGDLYGYRVWGPYAPDRGLLCNPTKLLLDPAARAVTGEPALSAALFDRDERGLLDSETAMPRCRIVDPAFDWGAQRRPAIPWRDTILYELHVKGFTQRHPGVAERLRGKYLGLAEPAAIDWLRRLGVTSIELMPCQAFTSEAFLRERGLSNYWGYNPIAWSAPATQYSIDDPVAEFQTMVRALHAAGLEVILDVVFNHTAEGDHRGPTLSLRGIDNATYYRLAAEQPRHLENWTGCGNTIAADQPLVTALILDSLSWWAEAMHVDGFRFDLAPVLGRGRPAFNRHAALFAALHAHPVLQHVKLIAEPWDVGPDGYQLGQFPAGWSEWNDRYRDTARAFWRGDTHVQGALAERCAGSSDLFHYRGRKPTASVNFITAHDGFTLSDLVSYRERRNEANLEQNTDGHAHNLSWNCGVEGPSDDPAVAALRQRQMRNLLLTLLVSQGVPMLLAGDEIARTQRGNNNAYCQDNETSWLDWSRVEAEADLVQFVRRLVAFRKNRAELRREAFFRGAGHAGYAHDVSWRHPAGREMELADWNDPGLHCLGMWLAPNAGTGGTLLVVFNAGEAELEFELPPTGHGTRWVRILDTGARAGAADLPCGPAARIASHTAIVCEARRG
ncbi:MAG TPA: glycogen debranching protein GlgX [Steroidobacteraceae bacterium]|nr:glycogen debranching protein GlgX [Steroidobacteraceae bacterium]